MWGIDVDHRSLGRFYHDHGVRLRQAKKVYRYVQENNAVLTAERKAFAVTLGNLLVRN